MYRLLISLVITSNARQIFLEQNTHVGKDLTNADFQEILKGFFQGVKLEQYTTISAECLDGSVDFTSEMQDALDTYASYQFYNGTDEFTKALGLLSPLSRHCANSVEDLAAINAEYRKNFKDFDDFLDKISSNVLWNMGLIKKDFGLILSNMMIGTNYTEIAYLVGDIVDKTFVLEPSKSSPLGYIDTDPLAEDPLSQPLWTYLEGTFKFLHGSKMATRDSILDCQEGLINFLRYTFKADELLKKNMQKEATYVFTDGLAFTNQAFTGCVATLGETWKTLIHTRIKKIPSNFKKNLGRIASAGTATYAEIFFEDWLSLAKVIGDLMYRIVFYGVN